jgi:hypothetical protein
VSTATITTDWISASASSVAAAVAVAAYVKSTYKKTDCLSTSSQGAMASKYAALCGKAG